LDANARNGEYHLFLAQDLDGFELETRLQEMYEAMPHPARRESVF